MHGIVATSEDISSRSTSELPSLEVCTDRECWFLHAPDKAAQLSGSGAVGQWISFGRRGATSTARITDA